MNRSATILALLFCYHALKVAIWDPSQTVIRVGNEDQYDFIIVGAGSAGCVLANRLTETNASVLLIEAGGRDSHSDISTPPGYIKLQRTAVDWQFQTVPQKLSHHGARKQQSNWPRGKVLGGSSSINAMVYTRGHPKDYDRWENVYGGEDWNWDQVEGYFLKMENWFGPKKNSDHYGHGGPLNIGLNSYSSQNLQWFLDGSKELGFKEIDPNRENQVGVSRHTVTIMNGERQSTAKAYLHPIRYRDNLYLLLHSHVTRLQMEGSRAVGVHVRYENTGIEKFIRAKKEVILSAGSVGTPEILMRSGIGPAEHLRDVGIEPVADLPVGKNLQDHLMVPLVFLLPNVSVTSGLTATVQNKMTFPNILRYILFKTGPLTSTPIEGNLFHRTSLATDQRQDLQLLYQGGAPIGRNADDLNYIPLLAKSYFGPQTEKEMVSVSGFFMVAVGLHPKSIGDIRLDRRPRAPTLISPNYLDHQDDVETLLEGIRLIQKIVNTSAFSNLSMTCPPLGLDGPYQKDSDDFWRWYIRQAAITCYHPVGTCRMGGVNDKNAVVDPRLKVRGVAGLRVVDASVIPEAPSANTNAIVIVVAEKGSDMIKEDHKLN